MESRPNCNLQYNRNSKKTHERANTHLSANNQYYSQHCERILSLADKKFHLQSNEPKNNIKIFCCEVCKKDINFNTKSSHIKYDPHKEKSSIQE